MSARRLCKATTGNVTYCIDALGVMAVISQPVCLYHWCSLPSLRPNSCLGSVIASFLPLQNGRGRDSARARGVTLWPTAPAKERERESERAGARSQVRVRARARGGGRGCPCLSCPGRERETERHGRGGSGASRCRTSVVVSHRLTTQDGGVARERRGRGTTPDPKRPASK